MVTGDLVLFGVGELGRLFAGGALRERRRVTPITRATPRPLDFRALSVDTPVLVAVGEDALDAAFGDLPADRRDHVILLQNELFPWRWEKHAVRDPTVMIVWFNQKRGRPMQVARPTLIFGPHVELCRKIHEALGLPCAVLPSERAMVDGLVEKYAFILTINALGVVEDRPLGEWLARAPDLVAELAGDARVIGEAHTGRAVDATTVREGVRLGMAALKDVPARGRTSEARVRRAALVAREKGLKLPALEKLLPAIFAL